MTRFYWSTCSDKNKKITIVVGFPVLIQRQGLASWNINIICHNFSVDCCVLYPFHTLLYLLNSFCACFIPVPFIATYNMSYICCDWNLDLVLFFYCLNACDDIPIRQVICTNHIHSYNRLLKMVKIWCKKNSPLLTKPIDFYKKIKS